MITYSFTLLIHGAMMILNFECLFHTFFGLNFVVYVFCFRKYFVNGKQGRPVSLLYCEQSFLGLHTLNMPFCQKI